ncbi:hypothetical protein CASFOL_030106 [Castilleja foliolosa]|uniref:Uncharacterized protein n=1 Tax=Castilleja foliolosa TaxID=1961234 RepID=A0ABD3CAF5_9LAMI
MHLARCRWVVKILLCPFTSQNTQTSSTISTLFRPTKTLGALFDLKMLIAREQIPNLRFPLPALILSAGIFSDSTGAGRASTGLFPYTKPSVNLVGSGLEPSIFPFLGNVSCWRLCRASISDPGKTRDSRDSKKHFPGSEMEALQSLQHETFPKKGKIDGSSPEPTKFTEGFVYGKSPVEARPAPVESLKIPAERMSAGSGNRRFGICSRAMSIFRSKRAPRVLVGRNKVEIVDEVCVFWEVKGHKNIFTTHLHLARCIWLYGIICRH